MRLLFTDLLANLRCGAHAMLMRRVTLDAVRISADQLVLLAALYLAIRLAGDVAYTGLAGSFSFQALAAETTLIALLMLAGYLAARLTGVSRLLVGYPIVLLAMEPWFLALHTLFGWMARSGYVIITPLIAANFDTALIGWFLLAALIVLLRATPGRGAQSATVFGGYSALVLASLVWLPPQPLWVARAAETAWQVSIADEAAFHAQSALLERDLAALEPERPGVADLYFVGFAAYAHEDVFMKEIRVIDELFRSRFDAEGRTVALINNPSTVTEVPLASVTHLSRVLQHLGTVMDVEEDVLVLYITSHGTEQHRLSVVNAPLRLDDVTPGALKRALDDAGIKWRVLAISACYAGGFIAPLRNETTLIMTAADAMQPSFGCGTESDFTFFGKAVFDEELRRTYSFSEAFARATKTIAERERAQRFEPSNPQIHVGAAITHKLGEIERRLRDRQAAELEHAVPEG